MAHNSQLPYDGDGVCMSCKATPPGRDSHLLHVHHSWHMSCLSSKPQTLASTLQWVCPDCSGEVSAILVIGSELMAAMREIESDQTLTKREKAVKRHERMTGKTEEKTKRKEN